MAKKKIVIIQEQESWLHIEEMVRDTVVQIFAQVVRFNWLEPYKVEEEFEQRATGFLINDKGDIVTNAHVVDQAKRLWVQIPAFGRHTMHVDIIGFCPDRDIALLRIAQNDLAQVRAELGAIPYLSLGDSDQVYSTDKILVLGYPLGQAHVKSTTGVISGRESLEGMTLLQITAPVNPGNSGGPLLNIQGQVIGITIASVPEVSNVGYAIPINDLEFILDDFYTQKFVRKQVLGVRFNVTNDLAARFLENPVPAGAYINGVFKGSLAERAEIQVGDMLYGCDGFSVDSYVEVAVPWSPEKVAFHDLINRIKIGELLELILYRRGAKIEKKITFDAVPLPPIRVMYPDYEPIPYEIIAGIIFMELTENHLALLLEEAPHLERFERMENKEEAVIIITHIFPGSAAQQLRSLFPGDILKEINGRAVTTLAHLRQALKGGLDSEFLTLVTENNILAVFSYPEILHDEDRLAKDYGYTLSETIIALQKGLTLHGSKKTT